jgi:hypothetical protein
MSQPKITADQLDIDLSGYVTTSSVSTLISTGAGQVGDIQYFTSSGTFTVPTGVTKVKVQVISGGGAGSANLFSGVGSFYYAGGGGASGAYGEGVYTVTPGQTIAVTIGAGGVHNSGNGGTTSFGSFLTATGGSGGVAAVSNGHIGTGGVSTGGSINLAGSGDNSTVTAVGGLTSGPYSGPSAYGNGGNGGATNSTGTPNNGTNGVAGLCIVQW